MNHIKILTTVIWLSGMLVLVPMTASAATLTQTQINAIVSLLQSFGADQSTVSNVQAVLSGGTPPVTPAAWCHTFNTNLKIGDVGSEIEAFRQTLQKEGFDISIDDDTFNEFVASAVTGFQQKYADEILSPLGLKYGTGFVGNATRAKLNKLYGCGIVKPPVSLVCTEPVCQVGYTLYDTGERDSNSCPIKKCIIPPTGNQPPVIYGVGGPTTLKINETGTWTIKASDPEQGTLSYSVVWGDEPQWVSATLVPKSTTYNQVATFTHSYASAGIYYPVVKVTDDQGLSAKTSISVNVGGEIAPTVSEQVKCVFNNSTGMQKCNAAVSNYDGYGCSGTNSCVVDIKGTKGDSIIWKSSCGGYAYTTMDGQNEYAKFDCATAQNSITVLSPNGGETWQFGQTQTISWKSIGVNNAYIYLQFSDGGMCKLADVSASTGNYSFNLIQNFPCVNITKTVNAGSYKVSIWTENETVRDISDAAFSIVARTTANLPDLQITDINPASVVVNRFTTYTAVVKNNSSQDVTTSFAVNLGGTATTISSLAAWQTATVSASFGLSILGPNQVCVRADIWNTVAESDESNNDLCKTVDVVAANTQPSITVNAPGGGDIQRGANIIISWTHTAPLDHIFGINLLKAVDNQGGGDLAANIKLCSGTAESSKSLSYSWKAGFDAYGNTIPDGRYKILVYDCAGITISGEAQSFNLLSASPTVNLKVNGSDGPLAKTSGYSTFSWTSTNADYCTASGDTYWSGTKSTSGSETVWTGNEKTGVTTYQITCGVSSGKVNPASDSVTVSFLQ